MWKLATDHVLYWHFNHHFEVCNYILSGEPSRCQRQFIVMHSLKEKKSLWKWVVRPRLWLIQLGSGERFYLATELTLPESHHQSIQPAWDLTFLVLLLCKWSEANGSAGKSVYLSDTTQSLNSFYFFHLTITCVFEHKLVTSLESPLPNCVSRMYSDISNINKSPQRTLNGGVCARSGEGCVSDGEGLRNRIPVALKFGLEVPHLPKGDMTLLGLCSVLDARCISKIQVAWGYRWANHGGYQQMTSSILKSLSSIFSRNRWRHREDKQKSRNCWNSYK